MRLLVFIALSAALAGCADIVRSPSKEFEQPIVLNAEHQKGLAGFTDSGTDNKAFAISESGHWGYGGGTNVNFGERVALSVCQEYAKGPCRIYASAGSLNQSAYAAFAAASKRALSALRVPTDRDYHQESKDWQIDPPTEIRGSANMEGSTPVALPGVRTIRTAQLVRMIKREQPALIDARGWGAPAFDTLPNAYVIDWIGWPVRTRSPLGEGRLRGDLGPIMAAVEADKTKPVVVFCESSTCWLSINAILRIQSLGYSNIWWYRGGTLAWKEAGLPFVKQVPYATLWSRAIN